MNKLSFKTVLLTVFWVVALEILCLALVLLLEFGVDIAPQHGWYIVQVAALSVAAVVLAVLYTMKRAGSPPPIRPKPVHLQAAVFLSPAHRVRQVNSVVPVGNSDNSLRRSSR